MCKSVVFYRYGFSADHRKSPLDRWCVHGCFHGKRPAPLRYHALAGAYGWESDRSSPYGSASRCNGCVCHTARQALPKPFFKSLRCARMAERKNDSFAIPAQAANAGRARSSDSEWVGEGWSTLWAGSSSCSDQSTLLLIVFRRCGIQKTSPSGEVFCW